MFYLASVAVMAKRRITQETFDAVVRENIEEFDMEGSEASFSLKMYKLIIIWMCCKM